MKVFIGPYPKGDEVRKVEIEIHKYDSWNADYTLALIALPLIKQLKETKHGSAMVDDADVPEDIRSTSAAPKENEWDTDEFVHARWDWVLDEILFALEQYTNDDAGSKFYDHSDVNEEDDLMTQMRSIKIDREGLEAHQKRVQNGFRLLGLHWTNLWD